MKQPPQWKRVLDELRKRGSIGVDRTDFLAPVVCDGWDPILNFPGRIQDLEEKGYVIGTPSKRHGDCTVYVLHAEPSPRVIKSSRQVLTDDGFGRAFTCRKCLGILATAEACCGGSYRCAVPNDIALTGCLSTREQEAPRVAA